MLELEETTMDGEEEVIFFVIERGRGKGTSVKR